MTIEELFHAFTDAEFQYTRFMKTRDYERIKLERYDTLIEGIRQQAIKMELSPGINEELNAIDRLDLDYSPNVNFIRKALGFITFGYSKRKFISKKVSQFYLREIHQRHLMVQMIQNHLAQE
jgi:hypothetical protein